MTSGTRTRRTIPAAALAALVLAAGAPDDEPATMCARVVAFAREHVGQKVGNGECTSLAVEALRFAGARWKPIHRGDGDYAWGRPVGSFREALAGDVIQFRDAVFRGKRRVTSRRSETWRYEYPHHTAVIASVRENGRVVTLLHQNVGPDGSPDDAKRLVTETTLRTDSLQKGGKVWIYRPIAPGDPLPVSAPPSPDG